LERLRTLNVRLLLEELRPKAVAGAVCPQQSKEKLISTDAKKHVCCSRRRCDP
jgi:hypothetical protein